MTLMHPWWLIAALMFFIAYFALRAMHSDDWRRIISAPVFEFLSTGRDNAAAKPLALLIAAIACVALSSPAIESSDDNTYRHSQGWIIIADVSRSMTLNDISPSRLAAMRNTALELADNALANSTTLIVYAGDAFLVTPPSFDQQNFKNSVALLNHGIVPVEGSNLTRALSLAWSVIDGSGLVNTRLFLLSDTGGFNNRSDAAIARLSDLGHRTDIILFGSDATSNDTPFDLQSAKAMAKSGRGKLLIADGLGRIDVNKLDPEADLSDQYFLTQAGLSSIRWRNQSHWLLLLALPLVLWLFYREQP